MKQHALPALAIGISSVAALNNGLALTPQMGWNTWNKFACDIEEDLIIKTADKMVDLGLVKLGYKYLNLDDCWQQVTRADDGHVQVSERFPGGMKKLADYLHSKKMLFGLYSSAGTHTCEGRAGGMDHEEIDAKDYASWGVDYLKYDNCYNEGRPAIERYTAMRDALSKTGRKIFYSICNWGDEETSSWAPKVGNSWRTTQDIKDIWASIEFNFMWNLDDRVAAGPGGWNDPDMLEVGVGGLTYEEEKTHFALWAVSKAPLIIGADLESISDKSLEILTNQDLIAVNQDTDSRQAWCSSGCSTWSRFWRQPAIMLTESKNEYIAVVVNWRELPYSGFYFSMKDLDINMEGKPVEVIDLYTNEKVATLKSSSDSVPVSVLPSHGSKVFKIRLSDKKQIK